MVIDIDEKTLTKTTLCECKLKCLQNDLNSCCNVDNNNNNELTIFLKCFGSKYCIYKNSIGFSSFICKCPTRMEIFTKYGK